MKKIIFGLLSVIVLFGLTSAHNPRLVYQTETSLSQPYQIQNPEISQAFYGKLKGGSDYYQIKAETGFNLYVNMVVPVISGARTDFQVVIFDSKGNLIKILDGLNTKWTNFWEQFAGDMYFRGPEWEKQVGAGTYTIVVSNPDNQGKYSLAVGKIEKFTPQDMRNTFKKMPDLKVNFMEKPVWMIFWNMVGLFLLILIVGLIIAIILLKWIIKKIFFRKNVAIEVNAEVETKKEIKKEINKGFQKEVKKTKGIKEIKEVKKPKSKKVAKTK